MKKILTLLCLISFVLTFSSCEEKNVEAAKLLEQIRDYYDNNDYQSALEAVDSLRRTYPEAVAQRKEALVIFQQASLAIAQQNLAKVDSTLQATEAELSVLKPQVEEHRKQGMATHEELQHYNKLRAYRDSLQGIFNMECAKIKYIHKRQAENEAVENASNEK